MVRMFVRHDVADYSTWREHYDAFDGERRSMGVADQAVYRSAESDTEVTITHDFGTLDEAKAFLSSPRLREVMSAAGVAGEPTVWFTNLG